MRGPERDDPTTRSDHNNGAGIAGDGRRGLGENPLPMYGRKVQFGWLYTDCRINRETEASLIFLIQCLEIESSPRATNWVRGSTSVSEMRSS